MKRSLILCGLFAICGLASAQTTLYTPVMSIQDQHISLGSWGSGTIAQTDAAAYQGTDSIRVSTTNLFQGGIIQFGTPVDLSKDYSAKDNLLTLTFLTPSGSTVMGSGKLGSGGPSAGGTMGGPGSSPGMGAGMKGGGAAGAGKGPGSSPGMGAGMKGGGAAGAGKGPGFGPGMGAGMKGGGAMGSPGGGGNTSQAPKVLKQIRLVITTTDGKKSEIYLPADIAADKNGWRQASVPLDAIAGFGNTNKDIASIAIAGDQPASIYVGQINVVNDPTPITGDIAPVATNLALGDTLTFVGEGYGGATQLEYQWNFGNGGDQVDAVGQSIDHKFYKSGTFKITLTIVDKYGNKAPYKTSVMVTVNP